MLKTIVICVRDTDQGLQVSLRVPDVDSRRPGRDLAIGILPHGISCFSREIRALMAAWSPARPTLLREMASDLTVAALPEPARAAMEAAWRQGRDGHVQFVLECEGPETPATTTWLALPWELLLLDRSPAAGEEAILGRLPNAHVIRIARRREPIAGQTGLRVLVVHADPGTAAFPPLPLAEHEARAVETAARLFGESHLVMRATPAAVERAMEDFRPSVLHFVGHGVDGPDGGSAVLHGAREGEVELVPTREASLWMNRARVRLCVFSSCWSAARGAALAYELVREGAQVAVGSQLAWRDSAGGLFANGLYGALAHGMPVTQAVTQGRQALLGMGLDWAAPAIVGGSECPISFLPTGHVTTFHVPYEPNPCFVGRDVELARVRDLLTDTSRPVAITGIGGLGKTSLAIEAAHRFRMDFPGGVYWIDARDVDSLAAGYAQLAEHFSIPADLDVKDRARRVRYRLAESSQLALVVIDNLTNPDLLQPVSGMCAVLGTTRNHGDVPPWAAMVDLHPINVATAITLLETVTGYHSGEQRPALKEIAERLGGMPLAVAVAAAHMRRTNLTPAEYAERLTTSRTRNPAFDTIGMAWEGIASFPLAQTMLTGACCFSGRSISRQLLARVCAPEDEEGYLDAQARVWEGSLVSYDADNRVSVHDIVRAFVRGQANETLKELAARAARLLAEELRRANEAMDWHDVRRELHHCRELIDLCRERDLKPELRELSLQYGICLDELGDARAADPHLSEAVEVAEELYGRHHETVAHALWRRGEVQFKLDQPNRALSLTREALAISEERLAPNDPLLGEIYNGLGFVCCKTERIDEARQLYDRGLLIRAANHGEPSLPVSMSLTNLGSLAEVEGNLEEALRFQIRAYEGLRAKYGDGHRVLGTVLNSMGRVLRKLGRLEEASKKHRAAMAIYEDHFGSKHLHYAMSLIYLALAQAAVDADESTRLYDQGLDRLEELYGNEHRYYRDALKLRY